MSQAQISIPELSQLGVFPVCLPLAPDVLQIQEECFEQPLATLLSGTSLMQHPTKISCKDLDELNVGSWLCSNVAQLLNFMKYSSVVALFQVFRKIFLF